MSNHYNEQLIIFLHRVILKVPELFFCLKKDINKSMGSYYEPLYWTRLCISVTYNNDHY